MSARESFRGFLQAAVVPVHPGTGGSATVIADLPRLVGRHLFIGLHASPAWDPSY